jgi:small subunit ribosomal protein S5
VASEERKEGGGGGSPEKVVQIRRCACVVKGGRRFSFAALVVLGDENGNVGYGYGKAGEVPQAVEKAKKQADRKQRAITRDGTTIPHRVVGRCGASKVLLMPAPAGTGIIAGATVRAVVESAGIKDILTKSRGSSNPLNLVRATLDGLAQLRMKDEIARLRGVELA